MPLLFSYGTLRYEDVQVELFGRTVKGIDDQLVGFEQIPIEFNEGERKIVHAIVRRAPGDARVDGKALDLTDDELAITDEYEPPDYVRISTVLASGKEAWVYAADE